MGVSMNDPRLDTLTRRERDVLRVLCTGCTAKIAGPKLGISNRTVEVYVTRILLKLQVATRVEAILVAYGVHGQEPAI